MLRYRGDTCKQVRELAPSAKRIVCSELIFLVICCSLSIGVWQAHFKILQRQNFQLGSSGVYQLNINRADTIGEVR